MTKSELLDAIAKTNPEMTKKQISSVVDAVFATTAGALSKDGSIVIPGFGTFAVRKRAARSGRNPKTGETIAIAESKTVGFKPAKALKDLL